MEEVIMFKCGVCGKSFEKGSDAYRCEFIHAREKYANAMLEEGCCLSSINYFCGFGWNLSEWQKEITKDDCFIESYLQCCDKPAYTITYISGDGTIKLWGCGSWTGYCGVEIKISELPKPHPKEELFVDQRYFNL